MGGMPHVLGYARVSTADQAEHGVSLAAQRHRIAAYCEAHGLTLAGIEEDAGISAKATRNRPGLQRALSALKARESVGLVVVKLDRLSRTTRDVLDLVALSERQGWALHSIDEKLDTGCPQGRFVVTILGALAQLEREQAAERTRAALAELRRQGRRISGKPPYGFRFENGMLVEVPDEAALLDRMLALHAEGLGARAIRTRLIKEGSANPRTGGEWKHGTVRDIVARAVRHPPFIRS